MSRAALGGMPAKRRRDRVDVVEERVVVDDRADQADAVRLVGVDPLAQEQQLARLGRPDRPRLSTHALPWSPELPTRRNAPTNTADRAA